jgi:hypothetical protein
MHRNHQGEQDYKNTAANGRQLAVICRPKGNQKTRQNDTQIKVKEPKHHRMV